MRIFTFKMQTAMILVLMSISLFADNLLWLDEIKKKSCCKGADQESGIKEFVIKKGTLQENKKEHDCKNAVIYIRDMDRVVTEHNVSGGKISFTPEYKGGYRLYFEQKSVHEGVLYVNLSSLRVYNKEGNISQSLLKEIRGKTNDSHYDHEPLSQLSFELVMEKPIKKHHINCCLYSGDIAPFRVYYKGDIQKEIPLRVSMESGWSNVVQPDQEGLVSFEIPRNSYAETEKDKKHSEKMIVEASYDVNESGVYDGGQYRSVHYVMTLPLSFAPSPLEYESRTLGFATAIGVMLVFSLGLYYNRRRKRKTPKEIYFDEE
ncbi:MAG: hypothetical protein PHU29_02250 [Sulfuricurvum sp.]|uniref:hypothetical protein n=1 Tax=Sulfuricurvum sp. TaxID=2025608 RepID=UPI00260D9AFD|nr:hypothetical protein [Sulfuricurvum sp.]MDD2949589.1 hypothetical protein [Sulfuricurvum sp.]MDD5119020.1 hypothetical protein [Sulfuricurvum sp.]